MVSSLVGYALERIFTFEEERFRNFTSIKDYQFNGWVETSNEDINV